MGQEELLKALEDEAAQEARSIVEEAERECTTELERVRAEVLAKNDVETVVLQAELEKEANAALGDARARVKALVLETKSSILEEVFEGALLKVGALPPEEYAAYLRLLYDELKEGWPEELGTEVRVNPSDLKLLKGVKTTPGSTVSLGVEFVSVDGRIRHENTTAVRLERARGGLTVLLSALLFKEEAPGVGG